MVFEWFVCDSEVKVDQLLQKTDQQLRQASAEVGHEG